MIKVKRVHKDAVLPEYAHETDTGFDLFTCEDLVLKAYEKGMARTGLIFELPEGMGMQVRNKSGNTVKGVPVVLFDPLRETIEESRIDITVYLGTVDCDYRGEVQIMVKNETHRVVIIPKHTKLAQGVLEKVIHDDFEEVEEVNDTDRGEGGFGSTGTSYNK